MELRVHASRGHRLFDGTRIPHRARILSGPHHGDGGLSTSAIVGIVFSVLTGLVLLGGVAFLLVRKYKRNQIDFVGVSSSSSKKHSGSTGHSSGGTDYVLVQDEEEDVDLEG